MSGSCQAQRLEWVGHGQTLWRHERLHRRDSGRYNAAHELALSAQPVIRPGG